MPGYSAPEWAEEQPEPAGAIYEDPKGRFSITLVGDWAQVETDGTYAQFAYTEPPLDMYVVTVESDDLEAGVEAALKQIGIDPSALTQTGALKLGAWDVSFHSLGDGKSVAPAAQVKGDTSYVLVLAGDEAVTTNPPENVITTIGGFTFAGE
ncbi:MAG: hypothetical protein GTO22_24220 [Gemmatimonadales bacterium]|nr:hypothetical protein [Gemmatimonadales bacterium]